MLFRTIRKFQNKNNVGTLWLHGQLFFSRMVAASGGAPAANQGPRMRRALHFYRCTQLLMDEYNRVLASFNGILHAVLISFFVFCVYGAVRTDGVMAIGTAYFAVWGFFTYLQLLKSYTDINTGSQGLLTSIQAQVSGDYSRIGVRELRSMRELRVRGGSSTFYFDKEVVLTTLDIVFNQAVNLLIFD